MDKTWDAAAYDRRFHFVTAGGEPLVELLGPRPGERIVDLGCGTGELTARIAAAGADVVGVDGDPAMVARAKERFPAVRFLEADAETATLPAPVDAVFSNAALHWMRRPAEVIARVGAALRPGGRFVAEMGGAGNVAQVRAALEAARAAAGLAACPSPWFFPTIAGYAALLEAGGLEPRAMWLFDRPTPLGADDDALVGWMRMFATPFVADLPPAGADALLHDASARARPALFREGGWSVDYRRLRFQALRR